MKCKNSLWRFLAILVCILMGVWLLATNSGLLRKKNMPVDAAAVTGEEVGEQDSDDLYLDTLAQFGDTLLGFTLGVHMDDSYIEFLNPMLLITVKNNVPIDTCMLACPYDKFSVKDSTLLVWIDSDTLRFDAKRLPDRINVLEAMAAKRHWRNHTLVDTFSISDSSWICGFYFQAYLPQKVPTWTKRFIKLIMENDIFNLDVEPSIGDYVLKDYYCHSHNNKRMVEINAESMTLEQIAAHYAKEHERLYREKFDRLDEDGSRVGPKCDYVFRMYPAWQSKDGKHVTYRFYTFINAGGVHGFMSEFYLTFEQSAGRLLGAKDFFKDGTFDSVIAIFEKKLNDYKHLYMSDDDHYVAALGTEELEGSSIDYTNEWVEDALYPRPAMTPQGVVFSYQPYEKGCFGEGILHFFSPLSESSPFLKIRP